MALTIAGCALTERGPSVEWTYYSLPPSQTAAAPAPPRKGPALVLGQVTASSNLAKKIVYRVSEVESGEYENKRWTDRPEDFVSRSLIRALFEKRSLTQKLSGPSPQLDIDIVAFEEVRAGNNRRGRVTLRFALHDEARVLARGTIRKERAAASEDIADVVRAIADALEDASSDLGDAVVATLAETAPTDDGDTPADTADRSE
jgi:cholesterol transport system auxiliary component